MILNIVGILAAQRSPVPATAPRANLGTTESLLGVVSPGKPCAEATHGSPSELVSEAPIWLPDPGYAKPTDAWTCDDAPVVMFDKIQASYEAGWDDVDVEETWARMASKYGGKVDSVQGRPAYIEESRDPSVYNEVLVVVDGTLVSLLADRTIDIGQLKSFADSIDFKQPANPGTEQE